MNNKKSGSFKKHFFLMSSGVLIVAVLLVSGYVLSQYFNDIHYFNAVPDKNHHYFLLWRLGFYSLSIALWQPFVLKVFANYKGSNKQEKINQLLHYKKKLIIYIVLFEVIISQNALSKLIEWVA